MRAIELFVVALTLAALLLPVHGVVFLVQKRRGMSGAQALRFSLVGVGTVFVFVFGLTALNSIAGSGRDELGRTCEELGGTIETFAAPRGGQNRICVVN